MVNSVNALGHCLYPYQDALCYGHLTLPVIPMGDNRHPLQFTLGRAHVKGAAKACRGTRVPASSRAMPEQLKDSAFSRLRVCCQQQASGPYFYNHNATVPTDKINKFPSPPDNHPRLTVSFLLQYFFVLSLCKPESKQSLLHWHFPTPWFWPVVFLGCRCSCSSWFPASRPPGLETWWNSG